VKSGGVPGNWRRVVAAELAALFFLWETPVACGYAFDEVVPDIRQPDTVSGGSACPVPAHQLTAPGTIAVRWSTALNTSPVTILTQDQTPTGQLNEIEQVIARSFSVWTGVAATNLAPSAFTPLTRVSTEEACGSDGINSICFDQPDGGFTPGVLAFTRVITADAIGTQIGTGSPATEVGQILDADIYFDPGNSQVTFATPAALAANPRAYDLESLMIHEFGHLLGFSHSAVWRAMMYPFAAAPGTFTGSRPVPQQPDAPLSDDDRTGLRVLYPSSSDTLNVGSIRGHVLPANPLSLPASPAGVTGIFGAHVVAVDADSGAVIAATIGGWSCVDPGPAQFDGSYEIDRLPVGHDYSVYAEPLDGAVSPAQIAPAMTTVCRNGILIQAGRRFRRARRHRLTQVSRLERGQAHSRSNPVRFRQRKPRHA
jgi:Matrixin